MTVEQGRLWLGLAQDALREESRRGEHLDQKGNWVLTSALAAMGAIAVGAASIVQGLDGRTRALAIGALIASLAFLTVAVGFVLLGMRVRATYCEPNPEVVI